MGSMTAWAQKTAKPMASGACARTVLLFLLMAVFSTTLTCRKMGKDSVGCGSWSC